MILRLLTNGVRVDVAAIGPAQDPALVDPKEHRVHVQPDLLRVRAEPGGVHIEGGEVARAADGLLVCAAASFQVPEADAQGGCWAYRSWSRCS